MAEKVTIIGAGIVGICTSLSLLEKGFEVELIDRSHPAEGASHGNAGVISPWSCIPQSMPGVWKSVPKWLLDPEGPVSIHWRHFPTFIPWALRFIRAGAAERLPGIADAMNALNRPNVDLYRQHLRGTGGESLVRDSMYVHVFKNAELAKLSGLAWRMRAERNVPMRVVGADELQEIEPALSPDYKAAILLESQARATDPGAIGKVLMAKAQSMGAVFRQLTVGRIKPFGEGRWSIETSDGTLEVGRLVVAAGAWSARLLQPLGIDLPLEAERGYHLILKNPGVVVNNSIMETDAKFVASSMDAGVRCAGTAEFAGLDAPPDYRRAQVFTKLAKRLFPDINNQETIEWAGNRPSFPDSLPCLGPVPGFQNLFAAFGHSHYGFGMAPNTGRIVAELVSGSTPNIDISPYRLDRFL
jgi:D-amino-acid dehydrogenase